MPTRHTADQLMSKAAFREFVRWHIRRYPSFHLTLVFEAGQHYHIVLHDGAGSKERIGVTFSPGVMERTAVVYTILKNELDWSAEIDREIRNRLLRPRQKRGSILLIVEKREVTEANFHRGELWP